MVLIKRLGVLFLLLSLLIPTTAFSVSGDGDIPEICPSAITGNGNLQNQQGPSGPSDMSHNWVMVWSLIVDVLSVLP